MNNYIPPFIITNIMLERISSIMKKIGKLDNYKDLNKMPILRRNNRIKSIHSSLAIEANSLSLNSVERIIDDKLVLGDRKEIQEVKNANELYENIDEYDWKNEEDFLKAHTLLMK